MTDDKKLNPSGDLQFDKAVYKDSAAGPTTCMVCKSPLSGSYFQVNQSVTCFPCKDRLVKQFSGGSSAGRVGKALGFGIPAAILGAGIYYAIMALTGYELGLVAIVIGWMVGAAVRKGSGYRGGLPYQIIAVILTYMSICSTYIPSIIKGMNESYIQDSADPAVKPTSLNQNNGFSILTGYAEAADTVGPGTSAAEVNSAPEEKISVFQYVIGFMFIFVFALAAPFMMGLNNVIGLVIIGFGVFEAWKMNKKTVLDIQGPFELRGNPPA